MENVNTTKKNAVIFDLDGVIVHTDDLHFKAWGAIAEKLNIPFTEKDNDRLRGVSRNESLDILLSLGGDNFSNSISSKQRADLAEEKNDIYRELLNTLSPEVVSPAVHRTLVGLRARGYKLAIGSSSKNAKPILRQIGLINHFDAISDGTDITNSKPHPEVFWHAASSLDLDPNECIVVEDAHAGVEAALTGGFACVGIGDASSHPEVHHSIEELDHLLAVV